MVYITRTDPESIIDAPPSRMRTVRVVVGDSDEADVG
jgi:hypothetical protein